MIKSLIDGLSEKDMTAVMEEYTLTQFFWPTLFPLRYTPNLTWQQLSGEAGAPIAGDVISWDARSPRKRRDVVSKLTGDIFKIGLAREKTESEMMEYNRLRNLASDAAQARLVEWIWEDQDFVYNGVNARIEILALQAASTGKFSLTNTNNDGNLVTQYNVDFKVPSTNKSGVAVSFTEANAATSKPITEIKAIVKKARAKGRILRYIFTDQETLDGILASAETVKFCATWVMQVSGILPEISRMSLNTALQRAGLPIIGVVESYVQTEIKSDRTLIAPWEAGTMLFSETPTLGNTWYTDLADDWVESTVALKAKREHVLIKRFANEEPLYETCLGIANATPVLAGADKKYLVDALHSTWSH